MQLYKQANKITISIAPEFPFGYKDVYPIVLGYLLECYLTNEEYEIEEIRRKLRQRIREGLK